VLILNKNLSAIERIVVCMQMDGLAAALSMTFSEKDTLSSRWFVYLSQLIKLLTLVAVGFILVTLPHAETHETVHVIWGTRFDFSNKIPMSVLLYGALRILVEAHSSWQSLSWTMIFNELEHQNCRTLTDRVEHTISSLEGADHLSRTDSRASIIQHQAPIDTETSLDEAGGEFTSSSHNPDYQSTVQEQHLVQVDLHKIYDAWPGTVFSTFLEQFDFSISALLSAEIVVAQSTVRNALSWGQTATMFTCAAGVLHWLYVQSRNIRKSRLFSRERYPVTQLAQHLRASLSHMLRTCATKIRQFDYLR
jgi:hypothetical protein